MKKRFSKSSTLESLMAISENKRVANNFDPRNGTAQLRKQKTSFADDAFINKCVEYGRWAMLNALIRDIEEGNL
jgi:hypothetical protein